MRSDTPRARLGTVWTLAATLFLITAAVNLQAPLYGQYARESHYGAGAQAVAFACYVAGLTPTLLFFSGLSDRIGRKRTLVFALSLAGVGTALVMIWPRLEALAVARAVYGVASGLMAGAGTAFLAERLAHDANGAQKAATIVTASTSLGFGSGSLATGIALLHTPGQLVPPTYALYLLAAFCGLIALSRVPERVVVRGTGWFRRPAILPGTVPYCFAILIAWSAVGMVIAVIPVALAAHGHAAWAGFSVFFVTASGLLFQPLARRLAPRTAMRLGLILIPLGFAVLAVGAVSSRLSLLLAGCVMASSACYGFTYLGGLSAVSVAATNENRARASAGYFLSAYFGFSVPVVVSGFLADRFGVANALTLFGVVIALASAVLGLLTLRPRGAAASETPPVHSR